MANRIVTATVTGETIKLSEKSAGAAGSFNAVSLAFTFDSKWDGTTSKIVQFLDAYGANPVNITLTSGMLVSGAYIVPIPAEPLVYAGEMTVTVRGVDFEEDGTTAERIIVSASTTMKVLSSLYEVGGATPVEPTPTQAEQLLAAVSSVTGMTATAVELASGVTAYVTKTDNVDGTINLEFGLPAGPKGDTGDKGATGATGAQGIQGIQGIQGVQGYYIGSVYKKSGTGAAGTTDVYGMKLNDVSETEVGTFNVYNGSDGEGSGTVTSITAGTGLSGGTITSTGTIAVNYGTTSTTACAGNDSRLSDPRTPTAHKSTHASGEADALSPSDIGAATTTHTHGNITNDGKIGSTADLFVVTGTSGALTTKSIADATTLLGAANISIGSYVGTGTYGASNPTTIPIDSDTVMVIISSTSGGAIIFPTLLSSTYKGSSFFKYNDYSLGVASSTTYIKLDSNTLYIYYSVAVLQYNETDVTYTYYLLKK